MRRRAQHFLQQARPVRVQFDGGNLGLGILVGDGESLASGSGTAVQDARTMADQGGNQLRGFVLNDDAAFAEGSSFGDISGLHAASGGEKGAGVELDSFG